MAPRVARTGPATTARAVGITATTTAADVAGPSTASAVPAGAEGQACTARSSLSRATGGSISTAGAASGARPSEAATQLCATSVARTGGGRTGASTVTAHAEIAVPAAASTTAASTTGDGEERGGGVANRGEPEVRLPAPIAARRRGQAAAAASDVDSDGECEAAGNRPFRGDEGAIAADTSRKPCATDSPGGGDGECAGYPRCTERSVFLVGAAEGCTARGVRAVGATGCGRRNEEVRRCLDHERCAVVDCGLLDREGVDTGREALGDRHAAGHSRVGDHRVDVRCACADRVVRGADRQGGRTRSGGAGCLDRGACDEDLRGWDRVAVVRGCRRARGGRAIPVARRRRDIQRRGRRCVVHSVLCEGDQWRCRRGVAGVCEGDGRQRGRRFDVHEDAVAPRRAEVGRDLVRRTGHCGCRRVVECRVEGLLQCARGGRRASECGVGQCGVVLVTCQCVECEEA